MYSIRFKALSDKALKGKLTQRESDSALFILRNIQKHHHYKAQHHTN
ncbi:MAG: hypothetical protein KME59_13520 [Trichormus sp. ATA11-4-KO1]|jgi:hypothetical protein|nr:hypothetical protein [Trichormus sp. ATA11-4-KO1]